MTEDDLAPNKTLHWYVNTLLKATGEILEKTRDTPQFDTIDRITNYMDTLLIEMRHADWRQEVG